jgi:hypothetical protein
VALREAPTQAIAAHGVVDVTALLLMTANELCYAAQPALDEPGMLVSLLLISRATGRPVTSGKHRLIAVPINS